MSEAGRMQWLVEHVNTRFRHSAEKAAAVMERHSGKEPAEEVRQTLAALEEEAVLKVAFIGQYNAGKSTIISALTGNRDIKIASDIATDRATSYQWNGILLTDTPGLWTERTEHDAITMQAIREADLLVFVITSDLFSPVTLRNFKELAYEQGFKYKMMLVVNKMSAEDGDHAQLVANYKESLSEALHPHKLEDFRIVFIDAADFLESEGDPEMIAMSHFEDLIENLNAFVRERGLLGRLDRPVRAVLNVVQNAQVKAAAHEETRKYFTLVERLERRVERSLRQSEIQARGMAADLRSKVVRLGSDLAMQIGQEGLAFEGELERVNVEIERLADETSQRMASMLEREREELEAELAELFASDLGKAYFAGVMAEGKAEVQNVSGGDLSSLQRNLQGLQKITSMVSPKLLEFFGHSGTGFFFKSADIAGGQAHQLVYNLGKFFGAKFRPWQAVKLTRYGGNFLKALGPVVAVVTAVLEFLQVLKEAERAEKLREARQACHNSFVDIGEALQEQFLKEFAAYEKAYYTPVLEEIRRQREEALASQRRLSAYQEELSEVATELKGLLQTVADEAAT